MITLTITLMQSDLVWQDIDANLENFSGKINNLEKDTDLIILPEMFNTGFSMESQKLAEKAGGKTMQWMKDTASKADAVILGSLITEDENRFYNRMIWMRPDGSYEEYDKRHLFRMAEEHHHYSAGNKRIIVELKGWKVCPLVCYDLRFPVWSRNCDFSENKKEPAFDLLIYNANWPEARSDAWSKLLLARAIENQVYVAGVNRVGEDGKGISYSGNSVMVDPKGVEMEKSPAGKEDIITIELSYAELQRFREKFPVALDADDFKMEI